MQIATGLKTKYIGARTIAPLIPNVTIFFASSVLHKCTNTFFLRKLNTLEAYRVKSEVHASPVDLILLLRDNHH